MKASDGDDRLPFMLRLFRHHWEVEQLCFQVTARVEEFSVAHHRLERSSVLLVQAGLVEDLLDVDRDFDDLLAALLEAVEIEDVDPEWSQQLQEMLNDPTDLLKAMGEIEEHFKAADVVFAKKAISSSSSSP